MIELVSDLGGGKTTFVQGLAKGLGYTGAVTSPTFTLSQIYQVSPDLELHHYDLYRLTEAGTVGMELGEDLGAPHVVTVIEWAGLVQDQLPPDHLRIQFELGDTESDRLLTFTSGGPVSDHLIQRLKGETAS